MYKCALKCIQIISIAIDKLLIIYLHPHIFRYRNILPYDFNRVRLIESIDGCDYINASWIAFDSISLNDWMQPKVTFVAAQGPMLHTTEHFLEMLFDHKIDIVIMLTDIIESKNK